MSVKDINEALGLGEGGMEAFLSSLNADNSSFEQQFPEIDENVKDTVESIDTQMKAYEEGGIQKIDINDIGTSLKNLNELIDVSKQTINHVYESVITSELVDSDLIHALAALMESTHVTITEYISLYKSRLDFYDKVRMELLKTQQKKELMDYKHKLDMETLEAKNKGNVTDVQNLVSYSLDDISKMVN